MSTRRPGGIVSSFRSTAFSFSHLCDLDRFTLSRPMMNLAPPEEFPDAVKPSRPQWVPYEGSNLGVHMSVRWAILNPFGIRPSFFDRATLGEIIIFLTSTFFFLIGAAMSSTEVKASGQLCILPFIAVFITSSRNSVMKLFKYCYEFGECHDACVHALTLRPPRRF